MLKETKNILGQINRMKSSNIELIQFIELKMRKKGIIKKINKSSLK